MNDAGFKKIILAIFPHADDEIGCVGTMANHVARGDRVVLCFATHGEMTTLMGEVSHDEIVNARERHAETVAQIIGCEYRFLDYKDTEVEITRKNAKNLAKVICEIKPDAIITWNIYHRHPDHRSMAQLVIDAVQLARIKHIVEPLEPNRKEVIIVQFYDERTLLPSIFVDVSESIEKIKDVTKCYAETYGWKSAVESVVARRRATGLDCDVQYAERFTILRRRNKPVKHII